MAEHFAGVRAQMTYRDGTKECPDCGAICDRRAKRCSPCAVLAMRKPVTCCADCGTPVRSGSTRCYACVGNGRGLSTLDRFWAKVEKTDGCWEWQGQLSHGYGYFWVEGKMVRAHRFAYVSLVAPIADGLHVCHRCDNPRCVRPDHLFAGTASENMQELRRQGASSVGYRWIVRRLVTAEPRSLFDALDLPPEAAALQDAYWSAKREWEAREQAYRVALGDILARVERSS